MFRLMVIVYRNLNVNWVRILLSKMKEEMKKIVKKFDAKGLFWELVVKSRLNFCIEILLLILKNVQRAEWNDSVEFDNPECFPNDARQFQMALGINNNSLLTASALIMSFLVKMGQTSSQWTEPQAIVASAEGEPTVQSPP